MDLLFERMTSKIQSINVCSLLKIMLHAKKNRLETDPQQMQESRNNGQQAVSHTHTSINFYTCSYFKSLVHLKSL